MGNIFYTPVAPPLGRVGQGQVGFALLFANLILTQLAHA